MLFLVHSKSSAPGSLSTDDRPKHLPYEACALLEKHERGRENIRSPAQAL